MLTKSVKSCFSTVKSCISKINITFLDKAEDFDSTLLSYSVSEFNNNYSLRSEILRNYYRDKVNYSGNEKNNNDNKLNINKITKSNSF